MNMNDGWNMEWMKWNEYGILEYGLWDEYGMEIWNIG